jgi:hypothetical protein
VLAIVLVATGFQVAAPTRADAAPVSVDTIWSREFPGGVIESSPLAVELQGSRRDIVVGSHDENVYALRSDNGNNVAGWPRGTGSRVDSSASAADTNGDGRNEIFIGSGTPGISSGSMRSFESDGTPRWTYQPKDNDTPSLAMFSTPALGEVNNDGQTDVSGFALGLLGWSFRQDGAVNPGWPFYQDDTTFSSPALMDVDRDGQTDYVVGGDSTPGGPVDHRGGFVRALRGDGSLIWSFKTDEIVRSSPSVGDIDGDGEPEIVVGTGEYWVRNGGASDSEKIFVLDRNGKLKWSRDLNGYTSPSPTLADINGDGTLDIAMATWGDSASQAKIWALDGNNNPLPGFNNKTNPGGVNLAQITTADIDADGGQDLIVPTGGGLFAYSGKTGEQLFHKEGGTTDFKSAPLVTDIDGNGRVDVIAAGTRPGSGRGVVHRFELPPSSEMGDLGWHQFRKDNRRTGSWVSTPLRKSYCTQNPNEGYWMTASDGGVFAFCDAPFHGSQGGKPLNRPVVGMAPLSDNSGYWQVASDGGIFAHGNARFYGSQGGNRLNSPVVGMAATPDGGGYWLVAEDGGIFAHGNARFYGSQGGNRLNRPVVGMESTPDGRGYWMVASDGGIFAHGNARFRGSQGGQRLNSPVVDMTATQDGNGYRLIAADGGVFAFNASFLGSTGSIRLNRPVVDGATATTD